MKEMKDIKPHQFPVPGKTWSVAYELVTVEIEHRVSINNLNQAVRELQEWRKIALTPVVDLDAGETEVLTDFERIMRLEKRVKELESIHSKPDTTIAGVDFSDSLDRLDGLGGTK